MGAACRVVDEDARRHGENPGAAFDRRRRVELEMRLDPARQHVLEQDRQLRELLRPVEGAPLRSCTRNVSSAMPSLSVKILASTMLAPAKARAPAMREKRPGWSAV